MNERAESQLRTLGRGFVRRLIGRTGFVRFRGFYWSWKLRLTRYENETTALAGLVSEGSICFDVGGNFGQFAHYLARACGPSGQVTSFEPLPYNQDVFAEVTRRLGHQNVELVPVALGKRSGESGLLIPDGNTAESHLTSAGDTVVRVTTLDEFCQERRVERLDFMKIDVEGFELNVLKGALSTLCRFQPVLMCEINRHSSERYGIHPGETFRFLGDLGYDPYRWRKEKLEPVEGLVDDAINYFFIARSRLVRAPRHDREHD